MDMKHMDVNENLPAKPFWVPPDVSWEDLPEELRAAIQGIVSPAYESLVMGGRAGQEQSAGLSLVTLLWLEVLQVYELGKDVLSPSEGPGRLETHGKAIDRLLRLVGAKIKTAAFLDRLGDARRRELRQAKKPGVRASQESSL